MDAISSIPVGPIENLNLDEMYRLKTVLETLKIPHQVQYFPESFWGICGPGMQICYPVVEESNRICSAICRREMSYGCYKGLIEIQGLLTDEERERDNFVGWLTAADVAERILHHYNTEKLQESDGESNK